MLKLETPGLLILAVIINLLLFYGIMQMVTNEQFRPRTIDSVNLIDFIRMKEDTKQVEEIIEEEEIIEPPPPDEPPPPPEMQEPTPEKPEVSQLQFDMPALDVPLSVQGTPYLGDFTKSVKSTPGPTTTAKPVSRGIATNLVPTIKINPKYPPRALRSGIEGVVTVEFTINTDGTVKDPVVVKADPPKIFDREVLKTIVKWKFNPEMENGKPVERRARQNVTFKLKK